MDAILIVDDNVTIGNLEQEVLERAGSPAGEVCTCGDLTANLATHAVAASGVPVALTRTEFAILKLLPQNPGQMLARSVLLDRISADTPDCTESSLKTHISHLRSKLREASGQELHRVSLWDWISSADLISTISQLLSFLFSQPSASRRGLYEDTG